MDLGARLLAVRGCESRVTTCARRGRHARLALPMDDQLGSRGFMDLLSWCGGGTHENLEYGPVEYGPVER